MAGPVQRQGSIRGLVLVKVAIRMRRTWSVLRLRTRSVKCCRRELLLPPLLLLPAEDKGVDRRLTAGLETRPWGTAPAELAEDKHFCASLSSVTQGR